MNILSLQSEVVYGHVGQGAARFALQRLGHEVWALPTVLLSNHAGYARVEGETIAAHHLRRLVDGLAANGWLSHCDAVLSGYLGSPDQADFAAETITRVRQARPGTLYCLDPVIGDDGRAYAKPGVAEAMARKLMPVCDIVTPNLFELVHLSGVPVRSPPEAKTAALRLGRPLVVATSIPDGADRVGTLAVTRNESWFASTPRLDQVPHGAGDLFAALFLAARLSGAKLRSALLQATAAVFHVLTRSRGHEELQLIAAQDALVASSDSEDVRVERIG